MKTLLFTLLFTAAAGYALADAADPSLPVDGRIKLLMYDESDVYTITTKYGYQSNIVFGPGEEIQTISVGDRSLWQLIPAGNRLFIRPMEDGAQTNMTLLTNKHSYQFDLKSLANGKKGGNIYVARFVYPDDKPKHAAETARSRPAPAPVIAQPVYPNYNYTYAGPDEAAPVQAYDDGKSTFIQYRDNQPLPSITIVDADGKEKSASYYVKNNLMVIETVAGEWRLEGNNGTVYLYNEMLNPK